LKCFKKIADWEKYFLWLVWQAKLKSLQCAPKYKFGYQIPCDYGWGSLPLGSMKSISAPSRQMQQNLRCHSWMTINVLLMQASTTMTLFLRVTRRYEFTLCMMSSMTDVTRHTSLRWKPHQHPHQECILSHFT
jgi:hypothetical protein